MLVGCIITPRNRFEGPGDSLEPAPVNSKTHSLHVGERLPASGSGGREACGFGGDPRFYGHKDTGMNK